MDTSKSSTGGSAEQAQLKTRPYETGLYAQSNADVHPAEVRKFCELDDTGDD